MAQEKELIRKRASIKGRLTAFSTYLDTLDISSLTSSQATELQLRIGKVEYLYEQYDKIQLDLECIVEDIDAQTDERTEFESHYYKLLSKAQHTLSLYEEKKNPSGSEKGSSRASNHKLVKLPTIQLPKFSGSYENWLEFRDTFSSLIHSNDEIDEINKFHYLRASLEGSAALVIQSIEFSTANYAVAWNLLCDRFDNKRLLIQNHVAALFNIEAITKESSVALKRLIDQINKNLRALQSLGEPTTHWDTLLIYMVTHKLDLKTYREWEELKGRLDKDKPITITAFLEFIRNRADLIETLELSRNPAGNQGSSSHKLQPKIKAMVSVQDNGSSNVSTPAKPCPKCDGNHNLNNCPQFLSLSNSQRLQLLSNYKVCYNCFRPNHYANHCKRPGCKICKRKHHSLIHVVDIKPKLVANAVSSPIHDVSKPPVNSQPTIHTDTPSNLALSASVDVSSQKGQDVLLSTALVKLYDANNHEHVARALLDSGSTSCLLTESMSRRLNLPTECVDKTIQGVNNATYRIGRRCTATMKSLKENFTLDIQCFILPTITDNVPCRQVDISNLNIPSDLCLADPNFYTPADVDLILGADVFWDLLGSQHIKLGNGKPMLHESRLGWLVSGPINSGHASTLSQTIKCNFTKFDSHSSDDVQNLLTRFWRLDEVCPKSSDYSKEEQSCEDYFVKTTTRLDDGRFCTRIPLKDDPEMLGDSYQRAKQCLLSFERRNKNRPLFQQKYCDFMMEYRELGHMTEFPPVGFHPNSYFIPHHGVLRESSTTTKLRVVFNASSLTSTGVSLNNIQMVGPTVQDDLLSILIRFRQHKYILAADVEKMYRQVSIHPDDRHLQQILWRGDSSEPIKAYQLNTVTYGTASAPFLATRCLKQISVECSDEKIAEIIAHDFYVDDLITGGDSLGEVLNIREQVTAALASACMPLRKWKSNNPQLMLEPLDAAVDLNIGDAQSSKTLGLGWETNSDTLCFSISSANSTENTKRGVLSTIAQIFDPLGLLAPCVVGLKMLLQHLWLKKLSWDEQLPSEIARSWAELSKSLPFLNDLRIPRHVVCDASEVLDLHIFTDASQSAYGACVYVSSNGSMGEPLVRLLLAKSRVAPIKPTTIPRLELCAALVGVRIYEKVLHSLRARVRHVTFWTDSMIVLGWIKMLPSKLQLFVRTRVAEITEKTADCAWRHVPTNQNPADIISRGIHPKLIRNFDLWWTGPAFLKTPMSNWPIIPGSSVQLPEVRPETSLLVKETTSNLIEFDRFSNLLKLKRIVAYMLRFIFACKNQPPTSKHLNCDELNRAMMVIVRTSQQESFPEYKYLLAKENLPKKSPLLKFNVFLDENNLMRVGGRLENSSFPYEKKHPLLIQSSHRFTKLLFYFEHKHNMHAGPQLLLASIKEEYWPIGGRSLAKACYRRCITCSRVRGQVVAPIMGNLPGQRLSPGGNPFEHVGVDYAGPMLSASRQGRGCRLVKVYIAIFICFTTKAIHLELVGDLTSNSYLLALRRFMSRRGKPINIYSDNGTSFVGAHNDLSKFLKGSCNSLSEEIANEGISFHFIPAYSPHFGGLWEAGVKSTKFHLQRVLGNCKLTYEELYSTLVQIEAILNSRPLTSLSSEPTDLMPLTPGHFLIGRPLTALPTPNYEDHSTNYLTRFQRIEQLRQHFWARWSKEYVSELQQRIKWKSGGSTLKLGSLVLLKEDHLPPLRWRLGRVTAVHPGTDSVIRVADVKTTTGTFRRAFSKICPLPENDFC